MSKVALIRCESYDYNEVFASVKRGIDLLGGAEAFVKSGEKILLKPNWLVGVAPERAATTHPMVLKAVAEVLQSAGAKLTCGDSPGAGHISDPLRVSEKNGCKAVMDELNIPMADFVDGREVFFKEARQNKKLFLANGALDCDGIISISKLKTHAFLKLTGAIKNQFGCVPGMRKGEFHIKLPDPAEFARMLVDLNAYLQPRLFVMDGIVAMEGNGPMNGTPKAMKVLLFSADPIALDATVCRMLGVDPNLSLTITEGKEAGLGVFEESQVELVGDPLHTFVDAAFKADRGPIRGIKFGKGMQIANRLLVPRPHIMEDKCKRCGVCVKACPVKPPVVDWHNGSKKKPPTYQYNRCIRCYCCQELCPHGAIEVKKPLLRKAFGRD